MFVLSAHAKDRAPTESHVLGISKISYFLVFKQPPVFAGADRETLFVS